MIKGQHPPQYYLEPDLELHQVPQRSDVNGSAVYGPATLGGLAGAGFGAFAGDPVVGIFTGIGLGVIAGVCIVTGKWVSERFHDE